MDAGKKERGFSFLLSHFVLSTTSSRYFFLFSLLAVRPAAIHPIQRGGDIVWMHE
jgi:hypothetical protein